jgi:outer membrane protein OmpA-like peptidoglycan-associated protein
MTNRVRRERVWLAGVLLLALAVAGCASATNTQKGAAVGAGGGAAVGAIIASATGSSTAAGALIGAVVGGTAGALIGREMDQQAAELETALPDAEVERVGEGIEITFESGILFDFDSSELTSTAQFNLTRLAQSLADYPNSSILIVGHTDSVGNDDYNLRLSQRRADAAALYLTREAVAADRIETVGRGETEPVASNETDAGRAENRRVEVAIFASEEYREEMQRRHGG